MALSTHHGDYSPVSEPYRDSSMSLETSMLVDCDPQQYRPRPQHRQIHRNRASYSCHSCRRRKVKCDRQHPSCGNCSKMVEQCVYSDNTGKGPHKGKDKHKTMQHTMKPMAELATGVKRRRTDPEMFGMGPVQGMPGGRGFEGLGPPIQAGPRPPAPIKEAELETRVNRLAEIVDQWYKVAYGKTASGQTGPDGSAQLAAHLEATLGPKHPHAAGSPVWPTNSPPQRSPPQRRHTVNSPTCNQSDPVSKHQPPPMHSAALRAVIAQSNLDGIKDGEVDGLALGHLSIQEGGRSRYVGSSFWALLSSEVAPPGQLYPASYSHKVDYRAEPSSHLHAQYGTEWLSW